MATGDPAWNALDPEYGGYEARKPPQCGHMRSAATPPFHCPLTLSPCAVQCGGLISSVSCVGRLLQEGGAVLVEGAAHDGAAHACEEDKERVHVVADL